MIHAAPLSMHAPSGYADEINAVEILETPIQHQVR
jgi:hypothetical protein